MPTNKARLPVRAVQWCAVVALCMLAAHRVALRA